MSLLKDSAKVFTGVTIQRIISLVMIPVIARLIGPKDYGIFQASLSISALFSILGSLSFEASIAVADSDKKAALRALGTSFIGLISGLFFWIFVIVMKPWLLIWFSTDVVHAVVLMTPFVVPLTIFSNALRNYAGYLDKFGRFAVADVASSASNFLVITLSYFLFWKDYKALIAGVITALLIKVGIFFWSCNCYRTFKTILNIGQIYRELRQLSNFLKFYLPSNALNVYSTELPTILLAWAFPENVVGIFVMAKSLIMIPTALCSQALSQVFYPKAARKHRDGAHLSVITWQSFKYGCMFSIFPAFFLAASSIFIIPMLLGGKWVGTAPYMLLLLPMVVLKAIETQIGIGFIFSILNQLEKILWGNLLLFMCRFIPFTLGLVFISSAHIIVLVYSLGGAVGYGCLLTWIFISIEISLKRAAFVFLRCCLLSGVCVLPTLLSYFDAQLSFASIYLLISISAYGFVTWFVFFDRRQRIDITTKARNWIQTRRDTASIVKQ
jgi:O-antigen/teichoic acid export membrane protein